MRQKAVTIKKHPVVFVRNLFVFQLGAFVAYSLISFAANYGPIYNALIFSRLLPYEIARHLILALSEGVLIVYIFARWFFERYSFLPAKIIHESGVLLKNKTLFSLAAPISVSYSINPVGRFLKYGTIRVKSAKGETIILRNVSRPQLYADIILRQQGQSDDLREDQRAFAGDLLSQPEDERLEFKSSLRWDMKLNRHNSEMEKAAMKTVAAFLNSSGGHLVIGVSDKKDLLGLNYDYQTLRRRNADGFENHFTQLFNSAIGPEFRRHLKIYFDSLDGKEVCVVGVSPGAKPAYFKNNDGELFFIRTGNSTTPLRISEVDSYIRSRWA